MAEGAARTKSIVLNYRRIGRWTDVESPSAISSHTELMMRASLVIWVRQSHSTNQYLVLIPRSSFDPIAL